jgi:type IV secretory pathway VirB4 component
VIVSPFRRSAVQRASHRDAGLLGPESVEVAARHVRIGDDYAASFAVAGYPAEVSAGWLEPLITYPGRLDITLHIEPVPAVIATDRLRRQRARLESARCREADRGRLDDPELDAAAADAAELAARLARGEGKLFRVGLYLTVHAPDLDQLAVECARVRALAASLLLDAKPASFRSLQGWVTTLPLGRDLLGMRRTFDTQALSAAFPFTSPDLPAEPTQATAPAGVLYGLNIASGGLVVWDRFACDNHNAVVLARSGAGKSYHTKLELLRSLYTGVQAAVIDPEDEYRRLAHAVGGAYLHLGAPGARLNPLDLPARAAGDADALTRRALFAHTLAAVLLGQPLDPASRAAVDRAVMAAYHRVGVTADPRTWQRPAPLLKDLAAALAADEDQVARTLAARLAPYTTGSYRGLFDGPTTVRPEGHLVVFSLRDLPDELKAVGTLLTLDAVWRRVTDPADRRRRLVVVDEAWLLLRDGEGAKFLYRLAKSARKHWAGLTVVTQDAADVLGSDLGQAVVANAATQVLLRQAPQAIDTITEAFRLSAGEREFLLATNRGEGLLAAGTHRVGFQVVASDIEHRLVTTDPGFLASPEAEEANSGVNGP